MIFDELAAYFEQHYVLPAGYVEGRKKSGVRSVATTARSQLKALRAFFGKRRLSPSRTRMSVVFVMLD